MKKTILLIILLFSSLVRGQFWENPNQKPSMFGMRINRGHIFGRNIVGCWLFSEDFASKVYDLSGNGYDGTFAGGATWSSGKYGSAVLISTDGSDDYIDLPEAVINNNLAEGTVLAWVNWSGVEGTHEFIFGGSINRFYLYRNNSSNKIAARIAGGSDFGTKDIVPGTWNQIVLTWNNAASLNQLYINAQLDTTDATNVLTTTEVSIGSFQEGLYCFHGLIDHVIVWNRALTAEEIALLYREPFCFMEPNWDLNLYFGMSFAPPGVGQFIFINMN